MTEVKLEDILKLRGRRGVLDRAITRAYCVSLTHCAESGDVNLPMASAIYDFIQKGAWTTTGMEKWSLENMLGAENHPVS